MRLVDKILAFVFLNKQPKSCFVYKWEAFFFFVFFIYQKTKLPTDKLFCFCEQNHFEMRNRNQTKKNLNWSFCFFVVDSFCLLPPQAKQKNALLQKWGDHSEDNTLALFEVWKTFLSLHCWFFWAKTAWNQKERKANFFLTLFQTTLGFMFNVVVFFRNAI